MATGTRIGLESCPLPRLRFGASATGLRGWSKPSSAARTTCCRCRPMKATGSANWKPTAPSNPTTSTISTFWARLTRTRIAKLANYVRRKQLADGGWSIYPGGPSELNATCKAYFALKLVG